MGCDGNNATPPSPAIAPGGEEIDARAVAKRLGDAGPDPRLTRFVPGFDAPFFQAGLAGYSDAAMRIIARRHGCPLCVTEALLDRTLLAGGRGFAKADLGDIADNIPGGDEDTPLVGQIMGSDPAEMAAAAIKMVEQAARRDREYRELAYQQHEPTNSQHLRLPGGEQLGRVNVTTDDDNTPSQPSVSSLLRRSVAPPASFAALDLNFACPVKKISRKARGGHWLAEPDGAIAIMEAVRDALPESVPVTLKLRRSFDDTPEMARAADRILDAAADIGIAWATVHGRSVEQKYIGPSRWDLLKAIVRRHPNLLILGSGDIWSVGDIFRMIDYTGVAAVSVARGCIGNPWIFHQARQLMAGREPSPPTIAQQRDVLEQHFHLALAVNRGMKHAERATSRMMRKFGIRFSVHHPESEQVRRAVIRVDDVESWNAILDRWYQRDRATVSA